MTDCHKLLCLRYKPKHLKTFCHGLALKTFCWTDIKKEKRKFTNMFTMCHLFVFMLVCNLCPCIKEKINITVIRA